MSVASGTPTAREAPRARPALVAVTVSALAVVTALVAQLTMTGDVAGREATQLLATVLRVLGHVAAAGVVGTLAVMLLVSPAGPDGGEARQARLGESVTVWAVVWSASSALWAVATMVGSARAGVPTGGAAGVSTVLDTAVVVSVLTALAAGVVGVLTHTGRPELVPVAYLVGLGALAGLVLTGHSAGAESWGWALLSLGLHVSGMAVWLGGLLALAVHAVALPPSPAELRRFGSLALGAFVVVAFSGILNVLSRMSISTLLDSGAYLLLLGGKVGLLLLLGVAGAVHRARTIARLEQGRAHAFWLLVAGELLLLATATGLAAVLARTGY